MCFIPGNYALLIHPGGDWHDQDQRGSCLSPALGWQGKPWGSEEKQQGLGWWMGFIHIHRDLMRSISQDNACVGALGMSFVRGQWPRPPSLAELSINESMNQSITYWGGANPASDWQSYPSITHWGSANWALIGQLTGRPTWGQAMELKRWHMLGQCLLLEFLLQSWWTVGAGSSMCL